MISIEEAIQIHGLLIQRFGGTIGIRNRESLQSALIRPYQKFEGNELYPTPEEKAAAIIESLISNHPFIDGNKRMGFVLMKLILLEAKCQLTGNQDELYEFVLQIATGKLNIAEITKWIQVHIVRDKP